MCECLSSMAIHLLFICYIIVAIEEQALLDAWLKSFNYPCAIKKVCHKKWVLSNIATRSSTWFWLWCVNEISPPNYYNYNYIMNNEGTKLWKRSFIYRWWLVIVQAFGWSSIHLDIYIILLFYYFLFIHWELFFVEQIMILPKVYKAKKRET